MEPEPGLEPVPEQPAWTAGQTFSCIRRDRQRVQAEVAARTPERAADTQDLMMPEALQGSLRAGPG